MLTNIFPVFFKAVFDLFEHVFDCKDTTFYLYCKYFGQKNSLFHKKKHFLAYLARFL